MRFIWRHVVTSSCRDTKPLTRSFAEHEFNSTNVNVTPRTSFSPSLSFSMIVNYLWYAIVRSSSFRAHHCSWSFGVGRGRGEYSGEENNKESRRAISAVSCYRILLFANRWMSGWIDRPRLRPRRHGPRSPINPAGFLLTGVKS